MASIFQKRVPKGRRRRRGPDGKVHGITDAGIRLLAQKDYEAISMAKFACEAGCSVGALYARFPEKNAYLYHLVASAYRTMARRAETELQAQPTRRMSLPSLVRLVVEHVVSTMTDARAAGVIRATVKLSTVKPVTIEPFEDYRAAVTKVAIAVLSPRIRGNSTGAVRLGMQIVMATVTDVVLQPRPGPMAAGTKRMKDALTQMMLGFLDTSANGSSTGEEADGEDKAEIIPEPDNNGRNTPTDANAVYDPDLRIFRKSTAMAKPSPTSRGNNSKIAKANLVASNTQSVSPPAPAIVKPPAIPKGPPEPTKPKRKPRVV